MQSYFVQASGVPGPTSDVHMLEDISSNIFNLGAHSDPQSHFYLHQESN